MVESKLVNETILEGLVGAFYDTFRLRNAGRFELNAKLSAGEVELSKNILAFVLHSGRAIIKDGTVVRLEFGRNAVITKNLVENVIIAIECLLPVKEGADDGAGSVIDSKMKDSFAFSEPEMERAVHLDFFAKEFTALLARMSILKSDLVTDDRLDFSLGD